jgi:hypothetical protein
MTQGLAQDESGGPPPPTLVKQLSTRRHQLVLLNIMHAPAGSHLHRLVSVLSRVEDISHILVLRRRAVARSHARMRLHLADSLPW